MAMNNHTGIPHNTTLRNFGYSKVAMSTTDRNIQIMAISHS